MQSRSILDAAPAGGAKRQILFRSHKKPRHPIPNNIRSRVTKRARFMNQRQPPAHRLRTPTHSLDSLSTAARPEVLRRPSSPPAAGVSGAAVRSVAPPRKLAAALAAQHDEAHHRLEGHHPHGAQQPAQKPDGVLEQLAHEQLALRHEQVRGAAERHDALPAHNKPGQPTTARTHGSPRAATPAAALGRRPFAQLVVVFPQLLQRLGVLLLRVGGAAAAREGGRLSVCRGGRLKLP
jgi:hypothetical protein